MAPTTRTMRDWLKVHRSLQEAEAKLAELAAGYDAGSVGRAELDDQHAFVISLRDLTREVFEAILSDLGQ